MTGPFRLVALDLDGTVLDSSRHCGPRTRAALDALEERGIELIFCTGRRYRIALPILDRIGRRPIVATQNGALVKDSATHETIARHGMRPEDVVEVVGFLRDEGLAPVMFVDRWHERIDFVTDRTHPDDPYWTDIHDRHREFFREVPDLETAAEDVLLVAAWHEPETLHAMEPRFAERFGERLAHHSVTNVNYVGAVFEAYSPRGTKQAAVREHRERLGIAAEEVFAVGDDVNDLGMIREAGFGVAMGNAVGAVKEAADGVTADCDHDGVGYALERWVLNPEPEA